ncbi:MAG: M50 family metallopeptidase [Methylococcales bacterium]|jgi:hypothetical protein|nr:M50 family metallopeptidase [Methylococcales bacterium]MBT7410213.1 M50 family metallopeptidase [Methylococcales bacterium]
MRSLQYLALIAIAFAISAIPVVHWPFSWLETYFHEISHGLMAIFSGGKIVKIELNYDGSGVCYTMGGVRAFVSFSGYAGAVLWGALIYIAASASKKHTYIVAVIILTMVASSAVLWGRDLTTLIIMAIMAVVLFLAIKHAEQGLIHWFLQFVGIYILINAARSPLHLLDGQSKGDGSTLAQITLLPEMVWIIIWELLALWTLWVLWKKTKKPKVQDIEFEQS